MNHPFNMYDLILKKRNGGTLSKDEIYAKFYKALATGGVLFIGSTEQIMNYREIGFERDKSFFFEKA